MKDCLTNKNIVLKAFLWKKKKLFNTICFVSIRYIINHRNTLKLDEIMGNFVFFIYKESVFNLKE